MSHSPLALGAESNQFTSSPSLSPQQSKSESSLPTGNGQHPTASTPTSAELAVILRPFLLG